jgi:ATP-dependent Clp protease adaptor protein ClpS
MGNADVVTQVTVNSELKEPPMFKVIYLNDSQTTMEFVIDTLMNFFNYTPDTAVKITQDIHKAGSAVVAVLPYEVAEQKGIEVTVYARSQDYPLQVKLEPESA